MYDNGEGVAKDYFKVRGWYEEAANQKNTNVYDRLGWICDNREVVSKDGRKAVGQYQEAAKS